MLALPHRQPDFAQFLKVLKRAGRPRHLPFYEHLASPGFIAARLGVPFDRMTPADPPYWRHYVDFWLSLNFDCIPLEIGLNCPLAQPAEIGFSHRSEAFAVIHTWADFERYPWPTEADPIDFRPFEIVARLLPDGVKIVGGVCMGPFEWASRLMGVEGLCKAVRKKPPLVEAVFDRLGRLAVAADRQLATLDALGALRQGDDLGFKSATFISPADLRRWVFPIYKRFVEVAHAAGKPFILHSCGNLDAVYADLIDDVGIDAKHSFEEAILPVEQFKRRYAGRVTPLGGVDVDLVCRGSEEEVRRCTRAKIAACFADGHYALGTGNSLTDYMPVERYLWVLDEGMRVTG